MHHCVYLPDAIKCDLVHHSMLRRESDDGYPEAHARVGEPHLMHYNFDANRKAPAKTTERTQ